MRVTDFTRGIYGPVDLLAYNGMGQCLKVFDTGILCQIFMGARLFCTCFVDKHSRGLKEVVKYETILFVCAQCFAKLYDDTIPIA